MECPLQECPCSAQRSPRARYRVPTKISCAVPREARDAVPVKRCPLNLLLKHDQNTTKNLPGTINRAPQWAPPLKYRAPPMKKYWAPPTKKYGAHASQNIRHTGVPRAPWGPGAAGGIHWGHLQVHGVFPDTSPIPERLQLPWASQGSFGGLPGPPWVLKNNPTDFGNRYKFKIRSSF